MKSRIYITLSYFLLCNLLCAQFNNLKFENLDTTEGLSSSTCFEIFQDKEGFLWFGTIDGLNKYNGYEFEVFRSILNDPHSISNNRINVIEEDNEGNLWIGTNNGLNLYNKRTNKFLRIDLYKQLSLSNSNQKIINDLLYDSISNHLWVATNNGVIKIVLQDDASNYENFKFSYYINDENNPSSLDNNTANVILLDENNSIWVGTNGDYLNHYNTGKDNFERILINNKKPYELNHIPKKVFIDSDGDFWIGNDFSNLILWNRASNTFRHVSMVENTTPILGIHQDKGGLFWVSTDVNGIYLFEKKSLKVKQHIVNNPSDPFSLPNNKPSKVFVDRKGIYWIGSYDKGVSKFDPSKNLFGHYYYKPGEPNGMSEKTVQSVLQDSKGRIWISAYNGGLNLFLEKNNSFKHYGNNGKKETSLSSTKILYTFEGSDGNIWVCTLDGGLNKFNPNNKTFKHYLHNASDTLSIAQNSVWTGVEDSKKRLWFGLRTQGISLYNPKTQNFHNYKNTFSTKNGLVSNNILFTFIDSKNRLLIGTFLGLNVLDLNSLNEDVPLEIKFTHIKGKGIEETGINHITEDHLGNIWLGADSGVHKLNASLELVKSYSSQDGLPNNLVVGIQEDNNHNLWISTKGGISLFNPRTNQFKNFNSHDGLQGLEFQSKSIEKTKDGRIIVGGINGFNIFHPDNIKESDSVNLQPKIVNFKLNNKTVISGDSINGRVLLRKHISQTDNLQLNYDENYISFEFLALNFDNPENVQYAYRMQGLDEEFINVGSNRTVNLSNLEYGDYTFEVRASVDGEWSKASVASLNIEILPPYWRTWWAYLIYLIIGAAIFWIIVHYYTLKVQEKQQHELDQMKLKFFVNVSHEFRTPLTLILNPVDKILSNFNNDTETIKQSAQSIQRSARRLLHLVNQLLDYRKMDAGMAPLRLQKGDIVKFSKDIFLLFKDIAFKKQIVYNFNSNADSITGNFDFDKVEKITTNLISNALKFTNSGGEISVSINKIRDEKSTTLGAFFKKKISGDYIEIIVEDTGIGLDKEQQNNIFSRFYNVKNDKSGTGIGLNFTKALVEIHQGDISFESQLNVGTKFIVKLPIDLESKTEKAANIKDEFLINTFNALEYDMLTSDDEVVAANSVEKDTSKKPVVLIVEDNKELRVHLSNDLKGHYLVKEAVNGEQGLKMVKKIMPDIVISDVMMPKMDGFKMCELLKTDFDTCHIPIILLTAKTLDEDRVQGYNQGADGYISKPFVTSVLRARIDNLLEAKRRLRKRFSEIGGAFISHEITTNNLDEVFLDKATKIVMDNITQVDFKQEQLLKEMGIGRSQFYRKINSLTGSNPSNFIRTIRLRYASELLLQQRYSIKEVTHMSGFNSTAYFSKTFRELFNVTPSQFVEQNKKDS
ncbi:two component regulator with propeller domain [Jejuia pallidilutea]|uniref:histidine kinase n=1 Tax=Jejuia pallidilutea TaxID=504487 RepID=A0A362X0A9_9FLAO|nr:two-component regulator propeller domain-containing protein [Jejuia pallidilutea]PQV48946.1 two component regulator with propeller domain [Jejuia pallidilutea]